MYLPDNTHNKHDNKYNTVLVYTSNFIRFIYVAISMLHFSKSQILTATSAKNEQNIRKFHGTKTADKKKCFTDSVDVARFWREAYKFNQSH